MWKVKNHILYLGLIFRYVSTHIDSIFAPYKSRLDLEMETSLGRYFLTQQNNGQRRKKALILFLFFWEIFLKKRLCGL